MVYGIISDIHSNFDAFRVVYNKLSALNVDKVICLGDIVGYNAEPDRCVDRVFRISDYIVRGNHDKAVAGLTDIAYFNEVARDAVIWTRKNISEANLERLKRIKKGPLLIEDRYVICHGSPVDEDTYIFTERLVKEAFDHLSEHFPKANICFFGHTHVPLVYEEGVGVLGPGSTFVLKENKRYLINPGSVGQPRDGINKSSFGVFDDTTLTFTLFRIDYPIEKTKEKVINAGLPPMLASRLDSGY